MAMSKAEETEEMEWKIESAADTLMRAEEVKADSKLHQDAMGILEKRQKALSNVVDEDGITTRNKRRGKR